MAPRVTPPLNLRQRVVFTCDDELHAEIAARAREQMQSTSTWLRSVVFERLAVERERARERQPEHAA